jgi:hypothetical protein
VFSAECGAPRAANGAISTKTWRGRATSISSGAACRQQVFWYWAHAGTWSRKCSFLKKRTKKLFPLASAQSDGVHARRSERQSKSFLVLFFKKEHFLIFAQGRQLPCRPGDV